MEEDENGGDSTPFWLQSNTNFRHPERLRRRVSSIFFSSGVVVLLLLVTAVFFLVFILSSSTPQIFKPNSVKKSWDSLNIILVLVAVAFGFLSRIKNEDRDSNFDEFPIKQNENETQIATPSTSTSTSNQWYNYPTTIEDQKSNLSRSNQLYDLDRKNSNLKRNSTSYPDLREFSSNRWDFGDYRRFYDDINVDTSRGSEQGQLHRRHRSLEEVDNLRTIPQQKTVIVDTLVKQFKEDPKLPPASAYPPPPPPPPEYEEKLKTHVYDSVPRRRERSSRKGKKDSESITAVKPPTPPSAEPKVVAEPSEFEEKPKRSYENERSSMKLKRDVELKKPITTAPPPPPPPPPLQPKSSKSDRKRSGASGSATKDFLNSLYQKKKKKPREKSVDNLDSLVHQVEEPVTIHLPPPSSPPAQSPSALQNLFSSKKHKRKRTIKVLFKPTPPSTSTSKREKTRKMKILEENSNSGGESPFNAIPPPPAFLKNPAWKFVVEGDYVRVNSSTSSRSDSPDIDELDSDVTPSAADAGGGVTPFQASPMYCPSPDVNTKAESFITNFRANLKLEKIQSMNKRDVGLSTLGPK